MGADRVWTEVHTIPLDEDGMCVAHGMQPQWCAGCKGLPDLVPATDLEMWDSDNAELVGVNETFHIAGSEVDAIIFRPRFKADDDDDKGDD